LGLFGYPVRPRDHELRNTPESTGLASTLIDRRFYMRYGTPAWLVGQRAKHC